jgi:hypothetical protein
MPLSKYFGGKGPKVMRSMRKTYGDKKAKKVFYAMHNARKSSPLRVLVGRR